MIHGIGIDIVQLDRIRQALLTYGERFLHRIYCPAEIAGNDGERYDEECIVHYAARFTAKEAAFKAIRDGLGDALSWHDFEVVDRADGTVHLKLSDRASDVCRQLGIRATHLSLSHTTRSASAVVVAEK